MEHNEIEACFTAGRDAPETATCPHHPATADAHWWTRGFSYSARLLRAVKAESETERLRGAIKHTLDENGHLADGDVCTLIVLKRALTHNFQVQRPAESGSDAT